MKTVLKFQPADIARIITHAFNSPKQRNKPYSDKKITDPGIILVKDEGVYIISSGTPSDTIDGEGRIFRVYAEGYNPKVDSDFWSRQQAFSPDDFAQYLPIDRPMFEALAARRRPAEFNIVATEEAFEIIFGVKDALH